MPDEDVYVAIDESVPKPPPPPAPPTHALVPILVCRTRVRFFTSFLSAAALCMVAYAYL